MRKLALLAVVAAMFCATPAFAFGRRPVNVAVGGGVGAANVRVNAFGGVRVQTNGGFVPQAGIGVQSFHSFGACGPVGVQSFSSGGRIIILP